MRLAARYLAASAVGLCAAISLPALADPDRPSLISLDYCADQFVLALADHDQIIGLSPDADAAHSFLRAKVKGLPKTSASTEEVLQQKPDLVLRTWRGDQRAQDLYEERGIRVVSTLYDPDPEVIFDNLERMGAAMGQPQKTQVMLADYRNRLASLRASAPTDLRAAYITASGFSAGAGTFVNDVIALAGFQTIAAEAGLQGWAPIPLEAFVLNPPDVIIGSFFDLEDRPQADWNIMRHPKFATMMQDIPTIIVPGRYMACNGFSFVDAAEFIRDEAIALGLMAKSKAAIRERAAP